MTDSPLFRAWAHHAFKGIMAAPTKRKNKPKRFKCLNSVCHHGTTRNQARLNGCVCERCGAELISKNRLMQEFGL